MIEVRGMLRHQNNIRPSISRTEGDIAGVTSHYFNDRNAAVAFGGCSNAFDAGGRYKHRGRVAWRGVIDNLLKTENCAGSGALVAESTFFARVRDPHPFVRLARII